MSEVELHYVKSNNNGESLAVWTKAKSWQAEQVNDAGNLAESASGAMHTEVRGCRVILNKQVKLVQQAPRVTSAHG